MPNTFVRAACAIALAVSSGLAQSPPTPAAPRLRLPQIFSDGMVLQRDTPIAIWGWSAPGAAVAIAAHGRTTRVKASANGTWKATLPPEHAGGPLELNVTAGADRVDLHDVYAGDVWVASGQSNMEFTLAQANDAAREIAAAHDSLLRQFKVPTSWSYDPEAELAGGSWASADPRHAGQFSAVAYFFGKEIRQSAGVPIGIINTTWGGSAIEAWLSRSASHLSPEGWKAVLQTEKDRAAAVHDSLRAKLGELPTADSGLAGGHALWAALSLDETRWQTIQVPGYWEGQGFPGMDGVAWYRLSLDLAPGELQRGVTVAFDAIDDDDITWINGVEVGRTVGYNVARRYAVPSSALHPGRNELAVRVSDGGGGGGINGPAALLFGDGSRRSLAGAWKFRVGEVSFQPDGQQINKVPTVLYNKMVYPLLPFAIKGVIWYQGESNANNMQQAAAYRAQFADLIRSWRREWQSGRENFPFLWVQLPNFGPRDSVPPLNAAWAAQRESMEAALSMPNTGRAVTIDVGDAGNIHPKDKQDVGDRLARVARRVAYGERVAASGPAYRSHTVRGDTVVVEFADAMSGLSSKAPGGMVEGFEIAGADRKFVWASARISGRRVLVWSDRVRAPVAVRYAWANNPAATLYNGNGLPAAPFRTDRW